MQVLDIFIIFQSLPRTFGMRFHSFFILVLILVWDWPILYQYEIWEWDFLSTILVYLTNKKTQQTIIKHNANNNNNNKNKNIIIIIFNTTTTWTILMMTMMIPWVVLVISSSSSTICTYPSTIIWMFLFYECADQNTSRSLYDKCFGSTCK